MSFAHPGSLVVPMFHEPDNLRTIDSILLLRVGCDGPVRATRARCTRRPMWVVRVVLRRPLQAAAAEGRCRWHRVPGRNCGPSSDGGRVPAPGLHGFLARSMVRMHRTPPHQGGDRHRLRNSRYMSPLALNRGFWPKTTSPLSRSSVADGPSDSALSFVVPDALGPGTTE
jgi:hypothetical protein